MINFENAVYTYYTKFGSYVLPFSLAPPAVQIDANQTVKHHSLLMFSTATLVVR